MYHVSPSSPQDSHCPSNAAPPPIVPGGGQGVAVAIRQPAEQEDKESQLVHHAGPPQGHAVLRPDVPPAAGQTDADGGGQSSEGDQSLGDQTDEVY